MRPPADGQDGAGGWGGTPPVGGREAAHWRGTRHCSHNGAVITVDPLEARIIGVLVEKEMTTPDVYPLTLAGVVAGCNQSTNRDPVMRVDEGEVERALVRLHDRDLATPVRRAGDRATKYRHKLADTLDLDERSAAVMAVLLLRGPQTPGELRQRTSRYVTFGAVDDVESVVDRLEEAGLAARLPRQPGQSQRRARSLLVAGEGEGGAQAGAATGTEGQDDVGAAAEAVVDSMAVPADDLVERVDRLERRLDELLDRLGVDDL